MPTVQLHLKASNLEDVDTFGKSDPYFKILYGDECLFKSVDIQNNLNPEWEPVEFDLPEEFEKVEEPGKDLYVYIYDMGKGDNHDVLGSFRLMYPFRKGIHELNQGTAEVLNDCGEYYVPPIKSIFGSKRSDCTEEKTSSGCFSCFGKKSKPEAEPEEKQE